MSILGALDAAVSGLTAQSAAFSNISQNVSNSQTVGYKEVNTSFVDYLTTSTATTNDPGSVVAQPDYVNDVQGTISQTSNPLNMAISGQGFFPVSQISQSTPGSTTAPSFSAQPYYTRAGDFSMNNAGYLVNSAGNYLDGWPVDGSTGQITSSQLSPIQIDQTVSSPIATGNVTLSANLPATPSAGAPVSSQVTIYDSLGTAHTITLNWTQATTTTSGTTTTVPNQWVVNITSPDDTNAGSTAGTYQTDRGSADVTFAANGTMSAISVDSTDPGSVALAPTSGQVSFSTDFGNGPQKITLDLGTIGGTSGLTQYAGTSYVQNSISQNGVPPGSFSSVTTTTKGDVVVNYDNGQSRIVARVPVVTFDDPNGLQSQSGEAFTPTLASGAGNVNPAGENGAGGLVTSSVEESNVDIAGEFSQLIIAQQAYSANAKVVSTANDLMQATLNMKQ